MARYFLEVAYKGTRYSGFQVQENANTIQAEVEKAFNTLHGLVSSSGDAEATANAVQLTGSSRTDAGVHALQNYFHFDFPLDVHPQLIYKINAILPYDIVVKNIFNMKDEAHSRFDAISREYVYQIHRFKDPFLRDTSLYYPYRLNMDLLHEAASFVKDQTNFFAFAKTNSQVKNFNCSIIKSEWRVEGDHLIYNVEANRFLRGMVRLLTASILKVGREKLGLDAFRQFFSSEVKCGYSVPAHGLFLKAVNYPDNFGKYELRNTKYE